MSKSMTKGVAALALGAFVAAGGYAPRAQAADLPVYVPPPEPVWSWTGPYVGLHVGAVDGDIIARPSTPRPTESQDPNGIMGGVQAGYNFQFRSIVLGLEGDISFGDVDDVIYPTLGLGGPTRVEPQVDWMATIRARAGWAMDRTLFYVTGGGAFTELKVKVDPTGLPSSSAKNSMFGWIMGGGVEHALTDSISFKAEYLYVDFSKKLYDFGTVHAGDKDLTTHTFRVGVNWLF